MISRLVRFVSPVSRPAVALCLAALAAGMAIRGLEAQSRPGGTKDIPLRISYGSVTDLHRITNDDLGEYVDQLQNVLAVLYQAGNQGFHTQADTRQPIQRTLCFDVPGYPAASACSPLANVNVVMVGYAGDLVYAASSIAIQSMTRVGQSDTRLVRFNWTAGNYRYRLGYGTDMDSNDTPDAAPALVTCTFTAAGRCTTWTLTPQGPGALYQAELIPGKGGKVSEGPNTYVGDYSMPFVETLTLK